MEKVKVTEAAVKEVSRITSGRRESPVWHQARKGRLTASNFGVVIKAKRATFPHQTPTRRVRHQQSEHNSLGSGLNETMDIKAFTQITGLKPINIGLWLKESGVLSLVHPLMAWKARTVYWKSSNVHTLPEMTPLADAAKKKAFCLHFVNGA